MTQYILRCGMAMRRSATKWSKRGLLGLLGLAAQAAVAQAPTGTPPTITGDKFISPDGRPGFINCYENSLGEVMQRLGQRNPLTAQSTNGFAFTPKGDIRFLVVYAGFVADNINPNLPGNSWATVIPQNSPFQTTSNPWPQDDPAHNHAWGESFPRSAYDNSLFYSSFAQFSPTSQDNNISNQLYQMSRHKPGQAPLRVVAETLPRRVNVVTAPTPAQSNWGWYDTELWAQVKRDYPGTTAQNTFDWGRYDQRTNGPDFQFDNSSPSVPDGDLDFVLVIWRCTYDGSQVPPRGSPYSTNSAYVPLVAVGGYAGLVPTTGLIGLNGQQFSTNGWAGGYTQQIGGSGIGRRLFGHEFAHCLYSAPHHNGANGVAGPHLHSSGGWGLMDGTFNSCTNAWENWYLGWSTMTTGPNADPAHLNGPQDLNATGLYTLRDFALTGDALRIKLPHSDQYVWLTNHTSASSLNNRYDYGADGQGQPIVQPTKGLLAMVEDFHTPDQGTIISPYQKNRVGALRPLAASGNFDFTPNGSLSAYNNYIYGNRFYDLLKGPENALGGQGDVQNFRWDNDGDNVIRYDDFHGNYDRITGNEMVLNGMINSQLGPYYLGTRMAFHDTGMKLGMMTNPGLIPHLIYDQVNARDATISTHGLSVETVQIVGGAFVVRVRFDDTEMRTNQRWTGDIALEDVPNAAGGVDLSVPVNVTLTVDKSGTVNRHTLNPVTGDFTNLTTLTCRPNTLTQIGGTLIIKDLSTVTLESGSRLTLDPLAVLRVESGATLTIEDGAELIAAAGARIEVAQDAKLFIRNTVPGKGLQVQQGAELVVTDNGQVRVAPGARLDLQSAPVAGQPMLTLQDDASEILTYGLIQTADGVPFTFGGRGLITFFGTMTALELGAGSEWVQTGPGRPNVMYQFLDGAHISVHTSRLDLAHGKLVSSYGSEVDVALDGGDATLDRIDFAGDLSLPGGRALTCRNGASLTATACLVRTFTKAGLAAENVAVVFIGSSFVSGCGTGLELTNCAVTFLDRGYVRQCALGVALTGGTLYLRNGHTISENERMGIYTKMYKRQPARIVAGDRGCAWIINNHGGGIVGQDTWLDLDALDHQSQTGSPDPQINRFDGNTANRGYIFDICYSDASLIPPSRPFHSALGNYWGPCVAGNYQPTSGRDYQFTDCRSRQIVYDLLTDPGVKCEPLSCASCDKGDDDGGGHDEDAVADESIKFERATAANVAPAPALALTLAPNPTDAGRATTLTLPADATYQYRVVSGRGQTVAAGSFAGGALRVSTAGWPAGAYRVVVWRASGAPARASQTLLVE